MVINTEASPSSGSQQGAVVDSSLNTAQDDSSPHTPVLSVVFYILAMLSMIGGFVMSAKFMPGEPPYGREWTLPAYLPSIIWFVSGVIQAALYTAIGKGLHYLHEIAHNAKKDS